MEMKPDLEPWGSAMSFSTKRQCIAASTTTLTSKICNVAVLRNGQQKFRSTALRDLHVFVKERICSGISVDDMLDENAGEFGLHIFYDFDCRKDGMHMDATSVVAIQKVLLCGIASMSERLTQFVRANPEIHVLAPLEALSSIYKSTNVRLFPVPEQEKSDFLLHAGEVARSMGGAFGRVDGLRTDKWSVHGFIRPIIPIKSTDSIGLIVLVALAQLCYDIAEYVVNDKVRFKETIVAACCVDLNPYSSPDAHLRVAGTQKSAIRGSDLPALMVLRNGECTLRPSGDASNWLDAIGEVCTLNYTAGFGCTELCAIGDPVTLPEIFLVDCKTILVKVLNASRRSEFRVAIASLGEYIQGRYRSLYDHYEKMYTKVCALLRVRSYKILWEAVQTLPTWSPPDPSGMFVLKTMLSTMCIEEIHSIVLSALFVQNDKLYFYTGHPSSKSSVQVEESETRSMRNRILSWCKDERMRIPYMSVSSRRSYLPIFTEKSLSYSSKFDIDTCNCLWRTHTSARVIMDLTVRPNDRGKIDVLLKAGCWNQSNCRRPVYILLDGKTLDLISSIYFACSDARLTTSHVAIAPLIPLQLYEVSKQDMNSCVYAGAADRLACLSRRLIRLQPILTKIARCITITAIEPRKDSHGEWVVRCNIGASEENYTVSVPLAPKWSDDQFADFRKWSLGGISEQSPGIMYLSYTNEIVAFMYTNSSEFSSLPEFSTAASLVALQMMIHICRPLSAGSPKLLFSHRNGQCQDNISALILNAVYNSIVAEEETDVCLGLVTAHQLASEHASYGASCTYHISKQRVAVLSNPRISISKGDIQMNSDFMKSAFVFRDVILFENWFRQMMSDAMRQGTDVTINVRSAHNCSDGDMSPECPLSALYRIHLVPSRKGHVFNSNETFGYLTYSLWNEGSSTDSPSYSGDESWKEKQMDFERQCSKLAENRDSHANQLVIEDAELLSSLDVYIQLSVLIRCGLIKFPETVLQANLTAHLMPRHLQQGAPWLVAAMEWGMMSRTVYMGGTGYPLPRELDDLRQQMMTGIAVIGLNISIHVAQIKRVDVYNMLKGYPAKQRLLLSTSFAHLSEHTDISPCLRVEVCDSIQSLPANIVLLTSKQVSVHDVIRIVAAIRRNMDSSVHYTIHVVPPTDTFSKHRNQGAGWKPRSTAFRKEPCLVGGFEGPLAYTVLHPQQTARHDAMTSGAFVGWDNQYFGC